MTVSRAFEIAARYRRIGKRLSDADLATVFDALDELFAALSKTKQRQLRPPSSPMRGRPRKWKYYEWWIGRILDHGLSNGLQWRDAVAALQRELLESEGIDLSDEGEDTLRNYLKRYRAGKARPRLPKK